MSAEGMVKRIAEKWANDMCPNCGNAGYVVTSRPEHASDCDGSCRHCPVEVQDQEQCFCGQIRIESAIREALLDMAGKIDDMKRGVNLRSYDYWAGVGAATKKIRDEAQAPTEEAERG